MLPGLLYLCRGIYNDLQPSNVAPKVTPEIEQIDEPVKQIAEPEKEDPQRE